MEIGMDISENKKNNYLLLLFGLFFITFLYYLIISIIFVDGFKSRIFLVTINSVVLIANIILFLLFKFKILFSLKTSVNKMYLIFYALLIVQFSQLVLFMCLSNNDNKMMLLSISMILLLGMGLTVSLIQNKIINSYNRATSECAFDESKTK